LQGTKRVKFAQVTIDLIRINPILIELKVAHGEDINVWIIIDKVRAPRFNDLSQFFVVIIPKQGREGRAFIKKLFSSLLSPFGKGSNIYLCLYMLRPRGDIY
jgi:hypothetical protein